MASLFELAGDLPDQGQLRQQLVSLVEMWTDRNLLIGRLRRAANGKNPIAAPQGTSYKIVVGHTYHLEAALNEKTSRFNPLPLIKVIPHGIGSLAEKRASSTEKWTNRAWGAMEEQSGGDSWGRQIADAVLTDGGSARIECAPAASWPEFTVVVDKDGNDTEMEQLFAAGYKDGDVIRPFESEEEYQKFREIYKQGCPFPMRRIYVPHENFLPEWDGSTLRTAVEIERRPLNSILASKTYDKGALAALGARSNDIKNLKSQVTIVHWADAKYHSYWALTPGADRYSTRWPDAIRTTDLSIGTPLLLHAYKYGIGEPNYNYMSGRAGGWRGSSNPQIEAIMEAVLEIGQDSDEVYSQLKTNMRHQGWPTHVVYYDLEARGIGAGEELPRPVEIKEGQTIALLKDEKIANAIPPMPIELPNLLLRMTKERIAELVGAPSLFGIRQPGVETGYHESLQIAQAEHLDNKLEANVAAAASHSTRMMYKFVKATGETFPLFALQKKGRKVYGDYVNLGPKDLALMPEIQAKVIATRAQDLLTKMQAFDMATRDRRGPGTPAMDDATARDIFLDVQSPDEMEQRIVIQNARQWALQQGLVYKEITNRLHLALIERGTPAVSPEMVAGADPALSQTTVQMAAGGEAAGQGGISPALATAVAGGAAQAVSPMMSGNGATNQRMGTGGGPAPGAPQMPQVIGRTQQIMSRPK